MSSPDELARALERLRSTATIRARCSRILAQVARAPTRWFAVDASRLPDATAAVASLTLERFPDLRVPYHSRWRHFEAGGIDRHAPLRAELAGLAQGDRAVVARALIDLAVVSVLLDAGAGADWAFTEPGTGLRIGRSEGLALASLAGFRAGAFSSLPHEPLRVDARALASLDVGRLAALFQVDARNPLVGLDGRCRLLNALGRALQARPDLFGADGRPGRLFDALAAPVDGTVRAAVAATDILGAILDGLSSIWPSGQLLGGAPLGDCWPHPFATAPDHAGLDAGCVPFHKLSQWLTYSLLEPFEWAGVRVDGLDALTGLPEYRNGGLLIDCGVLQPAAALTASPGLEVGSEAIVEWRALTVALLDRLAAEVRTELARRAPSAAAAAAGLPLAAILEGGTWAAGRRLAQARREGRPPLAIRSDGTVF